ncbi:MAG: hypothetical protein QM817_26840 [Archangium sp.]
MTAATRPAAAAKPAATPAPSAPVPATAATYTGTAAPQRELIPNGKQVATSASPNALWGEQPKRASLDREAFAKMTPEAQAKAMAECKAEFDQLEVDIQKRVDQLDHKWNNSRLSTRTEALREYQENSRRLSPRRRHDLDKLLVRSEAAQKRINELRAKADALPKTPEAKKEQAALRAELARELRRARDEQSKVVKEATAVVDGDGLKVDRLAVTEQVIDPSAPAPGTGESLLEKVERFFGLSDFFHWVSVTFVGDLLKKSESESNEREAESEKRLEQITRDARAQLLRSTLREAREKAEALAQEGRELKPARSI